MKKIYYLSTCNTNKRIINELGITKENFEMQDIKKQNIDADTLDRLAEKVGSYEALFSRRSRKFRSLGLHEMDLSEADFKKYMLEEYTFLKRPFVLIDDEVFVGSAKKEVEGAKALL